MSEPLLRDDSQFIDSVAATLNWCERLFGISSLLLGEGLESLVSSSRLATDTGRLEVLRHGYTSSATQSPRTPIRSRNVHVAAATYRLGSIEPGMQGLYYDLIFYGKRFFIIALTGFSLLDEEPDSQLSAETIDAHLISPSPDTGAVPRFSEEAILEILADICEKIEGYAGYSYYHRVARREMERSRESLAQLDLLLSLWKAGRWSYDLETGVNEVDGNWRVILGIPPDNQLTNMHTYFNERIHPEDRAQVFEQINAYMDGRSEMYHSRFRFISELKGTIWIEGIGIIASWQEDGRPGKVIGLNRDVTGEIARQSEVERSQALLRSVIDNLPSGVFWKDRASVYLGANDVFAHDVGVDTHAEVVGRRDSELPLVAEESDYFRNLDLQVLETGRPSLFEETVLHHRDRPDGWGYTSRVPLIDDSGEVFGLLGVYTDITKLKETEQQLRERESRLQAIFKNSSDIIGVVTPDKILEYISPSIEKLLGISPEEFRPHPEHWFVSPGSFEEILSELSRLDSAEKTAERPTGRRRVEMFDSVGRVHIFEMTLDPMHDEAETVMGFVFIAREITAELALQEELRRSQRMEAAGRLAAGIAHDFNNVLQGVLGYSELLRDQLAGDPLVRQMTTSLTDSVNHAKGLVDQLMSFASSEQSERTLLDLHELFMRMLPAMRAAAGSSIAIDLDKEGELPVIMGDVNQLEHLAVSLGINACETVQPSRRLRIVFEAVELHEELTNDDACIRPGRYLAISFGTQNKSAQGVQSMKLFEPLTSGGPVDKSSGLGLALAYSIVRDHDGFISLSNGTLQICLPAAAERP